MNYSKTNMTELAAVIAEHLHNQDIQVVLVGGLAVEIYTENLYLTKDIDMVNTNYTKPKALSAAMAELGFHKQGRIYVNDTTDITVEFPPGPLSVGEQLIKTTTKHHIAGKTIPVLTVDDVIKDRLAAYIHWHDHSSLIQATTLLIKHQRQPAMFKQFCEHEGSSAHYDVLSKLHQKVNHHTLTSMAQLEPLLTKILVENSGNP